MKALSEVVRTMRALADDEAAGLLLAIVSNVGVTVAGEVVWPLELSAEAEASVLRLAERGVGVGFARWRDARGESTRSA